MPSCRLLILASLVAALISACVAGDVPSPGKADRLFAQNRFEQARAAYEREAKTRPDSPAPHIGLMRSLLRLDRWDQAITEGKAATTRFPKNADLGGLYALALFRGGQPDEAKATARAAVAANSSNYWALTAAGHIADLWDQDAKRATQLLRRATTLRPVEPEAWAYLLEAFPDGVTPGEYRTALRRYFHLRPQGYPFNQRDDTLTERLSRFEAYHRAYKDGKPFRVLAPLSERQLKALQPGEKGFTTEVPMRWKDPNILFPAEIDGKPFLLRLDSGDADAEIKLTTAALRRLKPTLVTTSDAAGLQGRFTVREYKARTLRIGSLVLGPVTVSDGSIEKQGDGAIGGKVFERFALILDKHRQRLGIRYAPSSSHDHAISKLSVTVRLPFRFRQGFIYLPVRIADRPTWLVFDTGATITLLSMRQATRIIQGLPAGQITHSAETNRFGYGTTATRFEKTDFNGHFTIRYGWQDTDGIGTTFDPNGGTASPAIDRIVSPITQFEIGGLLGLDIAEGNALQSVTIDYPAETLEIALTAPPFTALSGYRWVTRDDRYLLFSQDKNGQTLQLVAATDTTRLPPATPPDGWQWVWIGAYWTALPTGTNIKFDRGVPPKDLTSPSPPTGYKALYWPTDDLNMTPPDGVDRQDILLESASGVAPDRKWIMVPRTAEVASDGTVTLRASVTAAKTAPSFDLPKGYAWRLTLDGRWLAAKNGRFLASAEGPGPEGIAAATDSTRLPPRDAPSEYRWVWLVDHWLLLPIGATIQTSPPPDPIAPPIPPSGYKRLFHPENGKIKFKAPEIMAWQDIPILVGNTTLPGWILVPEATEVATDGMATVR
jgi:tetratricopeptide (TPR) repeat protein